MAIISKNYTFSAGATIIASEHNSNFDTIYSDYNGNITNANISGSAGITDSKLAQLTTASKVSGAALGSLGSTPTGAGTLPAKNGGTGGDMSAATVGATPYFSATGVMSALAAGTLGKSFVAQGAGAPVFSFVPKSVLDYGTSLSVSTAVLGTALIIAFGNTDVTSGGTGVVTNLTFASSTTYYVFVFPKGGIIQTDFESPSVTNNTGAQFTITNNADTTKTMTWIAIGS